jgi:hypothetical protein
VSAQRPGGEVPHNIAAAIADVSDRASVLVREEIELAKAEVSEKVSKLAKGAVVGIAAGIFFLFALIFVLVGFAWLLYFYLPVGDFAYFWGFFAMAVILVVLGVIAGLIAARVVKRSSPPVPTMAIAEAQKIKATVSSPPGPPPVAPSSTAPGAGASPGSGAAPVGVGVPPTGPRAPSAGVVPPAGIGTQPTGGGQVAHPLRGEQPPAPGVAPVEPPPVVQPPDPGAPPPEVAG